RDLDHDVAVLGRDLGLDPCGCTEGVDDAPCERLGRLGLLLDRNFGLALHGVSLVPCCVDPCGLTPPPAAVGARGSLRRAAVILPPAAATPLRIGLLARDRLHPGPEPGLAPTKPAEQSTARFGENLVLDLFLVDAQLVERRVKRLLDRPAGRLHPLHVTAAV